MSITRITICACDNCNTELNVDDCSKNVMKRIARRRGWTIGDKVLCPYCRKKNPQIDKFIELTRENMTEIK